MHVPVRDLVIIGLRLRDGVASMTSDGCGFGLTVR